MKKSLIAIFCFLCFLLDVFPIISSTEGSTIHIKEMERISFNIFQYEGDELDVVGYQVNNGVFSKLPIGSTLDKDKGIFYWVPGPGFLGNFEFVFHSAKLGEETKLRICISPKFESPYPPEVNLTKENLSVTFSGPPFGNYSTPLDGSTVSSSIAVTGWALDDSGIANVKIYRGEINNLVYIGDAVLVEGARPDVEAEYPGYPNNTKAGWGYMMLTNFLPNGGNGTFKIHAIATAADGESTNLGAKTIIVDNANAVKPFGAIDTPTQGGTAVGNSFINWGWVLTPQPNSIPTDGSTIKVWVDGINIGQPTYNNYRSDIAQLFPGYNNSEGAIGYFFINTTAYDNGLHTIQWTATDSGGNSDGIGSRYFTIKNTYTLDVTKGTGVDGYPDTGSTTHEEGTVNYNYSLQSGYKNLVVMLDGTKVANSGTITMDSNHTLTAAATPQGATTYTLTVSRGTGVDGTPNSGATNYGEGTTVNYNYSLQSGYTDLVVKLDGSTIANTGTITMDGNHTLTAAATPQGTTTYTLNVTKGTGVNGTPNSGSTDYDGGGRPKTVNYNYSLQSGYTNLVVTLDGSTVANTGTITMDSNHTLIATATPQGTTTFTLDVTKGTGVAGTPNSGSTDYGEGTTVNYNYSLQSGYTNLVVTLDGATVANTGTITMDRDHTLIATAAVSIPSIDWVYVPASSFMMGDNFNEGYSNELPVHKVYLDSYWISRYEVTFDQYDAFCDATGRSKPDDERWGRGSRPVINVSWHDAKAFCDWMSQLTGENIHLPTEAQWEKAARGDLQRRYPWGDTDPTCSIANYIGCQGKTVPVGSYYLGRSLYGVHDMAGNVVEWCSDWFDAYYYSYSPGTNPKGPPTGIGRVARGGSWVDGAQFCACARRFHGPPDNRGRILGFRLAKD